MLPEQEGAALIELLGQRGKGQGTQGAGKDQKGPGHADLESMAHFGDYPRKIRNPEELKAGDRLCLGKNSSGFHEENGLVRGKVEAARLSPENLGVRRQKKQRGSGKRLTGTIRAGTWEGIVFEGIREREDSGMSPGVLL